MGAGISKQPPSNLPLGRELIHYILKCLCKYSVLKKFYEEMLMKESSLSKRLFEYPFEGFIQFFERNYSILEFLTRIFMCEKNRPNLIHSLIAKLVSKNLVNDVMTTNFDLLLERALERENVNFQVYFRETQFGDYVKRKTRVFALVKIHGSAHKASSIRATFDVISGRRFLRRRAKAITTFLSTPGRIIVVMGYSAKDEFDINPVVTTSDPVNKIFYIDHKPNEKRVQALGYPFESFCGHTIRCNTNDFAKYIWNKVLGKTAQMEQGRSISDFWKTYIDEWSEGLNQGLRYYFLGRLLVNVEDYDTSISFFKRAQKHFKKKSDQIGLAATLYELAIIDERLGKHSRARNECRTSNALFQRIHDDQGTAATLHLLGMIEQSLGNFNASERFYKRSIRESKRIGRKIGVAASLHQLGVLYHKIGGKQQARKMFRDSLAIKRNLGDLPNLTATMDHLARIEIELGHFDKARKLLADVLDIDKKLLNETGIAITLLPLSLIELKQGNPVEAERLCKRSLKIFKRLGNQEWIGAVLHQMAFISQSRGLLLQASRLYEQALEKKKAAGDIVGTVNTLNQLAELERDTGSFQKAISLYREALSIAEKHKLRLDAAAILFNIGVTHHKQQHYAEAGRLYRQSKKIRENRGDVLGIANIRHQIARIHQDHGEYSKARDIYRAVLKIFRKLDDREAVSSTLHNLAMVYYRMGKKGLAKRLCRRSLDIARQLGDLQAIVKGKLLTGQFFEDEGEHSLASSYYSQALFDAKKTSNPNLIDISLSRLRKIQQH